MRIYKKMPGIRTRRRVRGLTVPAAADALGVAKMTWYKWERGEMMPSAAYLPAMAELLQCEISELYEEDDDGQTADED